MAHRVVEPWAASLRRSWPIFSREAIGIEEKFPRYVVLRLGNIEIPRYVTDEFAHVGPTFILGLRDGFVKVVSRIPEAFLNQRTQGVAPRKIGCGNFFLSIDCCDVADGDRIAVHVTVD